MAAALDKLKPFIGKSCTCTWDTEPDTRIRFIDWARLEDKQRLLADIFSKCDVPGDYAEVLGETGGGIAWMSGKLVPIAFVGEQDGAPDAGRLEAIVVLDVSKPSGTVYAIPVEDGAAVSQKKLTRAAGSIDALKITEAAPTPTKPAKPKPVKPAAPPKAAKPGKPAKPAKT